VYNLLLFKEFLMKSRVAGVVGLSAAGLLVLGGCASSASRQQLAEIRRNPTPELVTMTERQDDIDNSLTVNFDTNLRGFNRDLGVLLLLDRPAHLSPYPLR